MSKLPNYEKDSIRSSINILKAYELNQQRESNIGVVKSFKLEEALAYHPKKRGHLRVAKEELQELEVGLQNINSRITKKYLQQFEHQGLDISVIKEEIGIQDLEVDVEGQLRKLAID